MDWICSLSRLVPAPLGGDISAVRTNSFCSSFCFSLATRVRYSFLGRASTVAFHKSSRKMKVMRKIFIIGILGALLSMSCTKKTETSPVEAPSPEIAVRKFVELSAQAKELSDKDRLGELCTGEMKLALEQMSAEQFGMFYLNGNISIQDFQVLSSSRDKSKAQIVYQVSVENRQGTDITKEMNQREVDLSETPAGWLIEAVRPKGVDKLVFTRGMIF